MPRFFDMFRCVVSYSAIYAMTPVGSHSAAMPLLNLLQQLDLRPAHTVERRHSFLNLLFVFQTCEDQSHSSHEP